MSFQDWWNEFNNSVSKNRQDKITHLMFLCSDATNMSAKLNQINSLAAEKMGKISSESLQLIQGKFIFPFCIYLFAAIVYKLRKLFTVTS